MSGWRRYLGGLEGRHRFRAERLLLPSGSTIGEAFERDPWQRELWALKDDPAVQVALVVGQRGLAKTTTAAAMGLEEVALGGECDVIVAANDGDQARLALEAAQGFLRRDPALERVLGSYRDEIRNPHTGARMKVITSDAVTSFGLGIRRSLIIFDELWGLRDRALLDSLLSALPKVPGSKLIALTNAGFVDTPAYTLLQLCREGDPAFVAWDSVSRGAWPSWMDRRELERQRRLLPASVFERVWLNKWASGSGDFLSREEVEVCIDEALPIERTRFDDRVRYYLGVDLGLKHDRSVVVVGHKESETFVADHIRTWEGTPERPVSLEDVTAHVAMLGSRIKKLRRGYVDPWQGLHLLERLRRAGMHTLEEHAFTPRNVMQISQAVWQAFRAQRIRIPGHGQLVTELIRARVVERSYGWRVDHESGGFSDHVIALGLALVASAGDHGVLVVEHDADRLLIEELVARIEAPRLFGFPRRMGLVASNIDPSAGNAGSAQAIPKTIEHYRAAIRLLQVLVRLDRRSPQEADAIATTLRDELEARPTMRRLLESTSDEFDPGAPLAHYGLGFLDDFVTGRWIVPPAEEGRHVA